MPKWFNRLLRHATRAQYDAAKTTPENRAHWSFADIANADQSNSAQVRTILRSRARYEVANNPWLHGMVMQVAEDLVGTGARLQLTGIDDAAATAIEKDFAAWAETVRLAETMRIARTAMAVDGEAFIVLNNDATLPSQVHLYPMIIDCDRVTSPADQPDNDADNQADGVFFNAYMRPVKYTVRRVHPSVAESTTTYTVNAPYMVHLFRHDRPEQHRGVPEITAALPQIAILRRYTIAMVKKMETSANISAVIKQDASLLDDPAPVEPWKEVSIPRDSLLTMPPGTGIEQMNLATPTDPQSAFALQVKVDCARCLLATRNVVTGDSSNYNYASGRLDYQNYDRAIKVQRKRFEVEFLDKVFATWFAEYSPNQPVPEHSWYWDGRAHVDPTKEAQAVQTRLATNMTTLATEYAAEGKDWQVEIRQRFTEEKFMADLRKEMGLPPLMENNNESREPDSADSADERDGRGGEQPADADTEPADR